MAESVSTKPVADSVAKINREVAVGEDLGFQRSWWRFERGVWIFFTVLIALDLAGVFGRGPLANARMRSAEDALDVRYERIERTGTPSIMTISVGPAAIRDGVVQVFVSDKVVGGLGAQRVIPQPAATVVGHGGLTYTFSAGTPPSLIRFELQPVGAGIYPFEVAVPGIPALHAKVIVMP
ncbi:MAG: hypothetical protein JWN43_4343 [Gammaproteobacteria bacterium]|nr:hypothetical protein [Gammaproteobacteria bacterium]